MLQNTIVAIVNDASNCCIVVISNVFVTLNPKKYWSLSVSHRLLLLTLIQLMQLWAVIQISAWGRQWSLSVSRKSSDCAWIQVFRVCKTKSYWAEYFVSIYRAESLKPSVMKSDDTRNDQVTQLATIAGSALPSKKVETVSRTLGPLGHALRDGKDTISRKPIASSAGGSDGSYTSDEIQVIRHVLLLFERRIFNQSVIMYRPYVIYECFYCHL